MENPIKTSRRKWQISIRSALILVLIICVLIPTVPVIYLRVIPRYQINALKVLNSIDKDQLQYAAEGRTDDPQFLIDSQQHLIHLVRKSLMDAGFSLRWNKEKKEFDFENESDQYRYCSDSTLKTIIELKNKATDRF